MAEGNLFDLAGVLSQLGTFSGAPNPLANASGIFQDLSRRQQATEQKASIQDQLGALIGNAPFESQQPLRPNETPQMLGGSGLAASQGMNEQQVTDLQNLGAIDPRAVLQQLSGQMFPSGQDGFTLAAGQTRFDSQGNIIAEGGEAPLDKAKEFDQIIKIRDRFTKNTDEFAKQDNAFARIRASAQDPSAAGDLALIFNYMKLLDPGSTVREGEFATAQNAAGVPDRVRALMGNLLEGTRLEPKQRDDFLGRSEKLYTTAVSSNEKRRNESNKLAKARNLPQDQATFERSTQIDERKTIQHNGKDVRAYRVGSKWYTY